MTDHDFRPSATWANLKLRSRLLQRLRRFFDGRGFLEVETPLLSADTIVDRHIDPLHVQMSDSSGRNDECRAMWLQSSPEFSMKRLLASGADAIYQITRAFRADETGPLHNVEFTIVEWYRVGDSMDDGIRLLDELSADMLGRGPADRLSYREAFLRHAGIDPLAADVNSLRDHVNERRIAHPAGVDSSDRDLWLNLLLTECVEPQLGRERPTILFDYPASQGALAVVRDEDPPVAERFELYVDGIELANGYHELTDANELRRRFALANEQREADGKRRLPEVSRLMAAMEHGLPPCTGVALGFDRLVMIAAGAKTIAEVMAFPFDRA